MQISPSAEHVLFGTSILFILAVFASNLSRRIGVPALILFLIIGMLAGSEGLGGIHFDNPYLAQLLGTGALAFILFSGALNTDWQHVKPIARSAASLASLGVVATALLVSLFVYYTLHFSIAESLLFGAIVSSTDAAAVFSILRSKNIHLKQNVQTVIEVESASNDPMAIFLVLIFMQILTTQNTTFLGLLHLLFAQVIIGIAMGYMMGYLIPKVINKTSLEYEGLYPVLMVGLVLLTYSATATLKGNGFLAIYLAGLLTGRSSFAHKKELNHFHESLTWLMQIAMFITLGLLVFPSKLINVLWIDLIIALFLIFVARPSSVFISLQFSRFSIRDKLMISWVGLRGAVPIILATYPLMANLPKANAIFNLVFFIVLTSVLIQGALLPFIARFLNLEQRKSP